MARQLFVNLAVADLPRSVAFFEKLGFAFNAEFTNEQAACMIINDGAFAMLHVPESFKSYTSKSVIDANTQVEALLAFSVDSREQVDELADKAIAAGGSPAMPPQDHGFMYVRTFLDPDGHHWEVFWMDPSGFPG